MPHLFDCSCRLRVDVQDPAEVHGLISSFSRLTDEHSGVLGALFAERPGGEQVELMLSARDVAEARSLAKSILTEIEQHLLVRFGPETVVAEEVVIREANQATTQRLGTPVGSDMGAYPEDDFAENVKTGLEQFRRHAIDGPEAALREYQTARPEGFPSTDQILAKIEEWRVFSKFDVIDVGPFNITLYFHELPHRLRQFAEEVLLFCPEVTDEVDLLDEYDNAEPSLIARVAVDGITENLKESKTLRLWWD